MGDDHRYLGDFVPRRKARDARACRTPPEKFDHLSLGEIDRLVAEASHRQKLRRNGVPPTPADDAYWASLNRAPRRPPSYDPKPKGAA